MEWQGPLYALEILLLIIDFIIYSELASVPDLLLLLLVQAALKPAQSLERHILVTAFAISMYNTIKRVQKPFKNLEQATYELIHREKGLRCIGEKVCAAPCDDFQKGLPQ